MASWIQTDEHGRVVGVRTEEPPEADADLWDPFEGDVPERFSDWVLGSDGTLAYDPRMDPVEGATPGEVLGALFAATPSLAESVPDDTLCRMWDYLPAWDERGIYSAGSLVSVGTNVYRCLQSHAAQESWSPDGAPSLWARVLPGQEGSAPGEWEQPDSTNPYMRGDRVAHGGKVWESAIDANVWEPGADGTESLWSEVISS